MKHTPTTWTWGFNESKADSPPNVEILDTEGVAIIALCHDDYGREEANAAFIVLACNNHDKLVEALKKAIEVMKDNEIDTMLSGEFDVLFEDVIAEAEGKE